MSDVIISLKGIHKSYGKKEVLKGVDLDIQKGEIYGLLGKNGSGKSTIFKVILGLSDYSSGTLLVGNPGESLAEGRSRIGFLVGNNYFSYATGRENLAYYAKMKGIKDPKKEIDRVLELVELKDVKTKVAGYSLGMHQRLGIANALLGNPEILILDEPTNGLDPQGIADVRALVRRLNSELGTTVIISSHILGELQNTAHKFAILNNGVIVRVVSEEDLKADQQTVVLRVSDREKAETVLKENGISVLESSIQTRSLENIFFELVGGEE